MKYKEVDFLIESYVNYFNFVVRTNIGYYKKKRLQEVEIRKTERDDDHITLVSFYLGEISNGVDVRIYQMASTSLLVELKEKGFIEVANLDNIKNSFKINSIEEMHKFFKLLEEERYFLKKSFRITHLK
jgi:hypothetical protein